MVLGSHGKLTEVEGRFITIRLLFRRVEKILEHKWSRNWLGHGGKLYCKPYNGIEYTSSYPIEKLACFALCKKTKQLIGFAL